MFFNRCSLLQFLFFGDALLWSLVSLVAFGVMVFLVERNNGVGATALAAVVLAALQLMTPLDPLHAFLAHPVVSAGAVIAYFLIGVGWGVVKWWAFCTALRDGYAELRADYMQRNGWAESDLNDTRRRDMVSTLRRQFEFNLPPQIRQHKARTITWMVYWPMSLLWTALNDPIRRLYNWAYNVISDVLQSISGRAFAKFSGDFTK